MQNLKTLLVGGEGYVQDLTVEQLLANIFLAKYLKNKFSSLEYVVGHHEYRCFEKTPLWLEKEIFQKYVKAFCPCKIQHGGLGAFYLKLKSKV